MEFLTGPALNRSLLEIIEEAQKDLFLISPYVKLHKRYREALTKRLDDKILKVTFIFREESFYSPKTIEKADLDLLTTFHNIQIRKDSRVHAKFYASEYGYLLSSMNLYEYSQKNNIEFGTLYRTGIKSPITRQQAKMNHAIKKTINSIIEESKIVFKSPGFETELLFPQKAKIDNTDSLLSKIREIDKDSLENLDDDQPLGYCIHSGKIIKFNIDQPFSYQAFIDWKVNGEINSPQNFCHFSGEPAHGNTTFRKPVLAKYWATAKRAMKFRTQ